MPAWSYRTAKTGNCLDSEASLYPADSYMAMAKSYDLPGVTDPTDDPPTGVLTYDDFFSATRAEQRLLYTSPTLTAGTHLIKVRYTGQKNGSSSGTVIAADRIDVTS